MMNMQPRPMQVERVYWGALALPTSEALSTVSGPP